MSNKHLKDNPILEQAAQRHAGLPIVNWIIHEEIDGLAITHQRDWIVIPWRTIRASLKRKDRKS